MRTRKQPLLVVFNNMIWILLISVLVLFSILSNRFLTVNNLVGNILVNSAALGILVIGQSFALITGNFDLSEESTIGLAAFLGAWLVASAGQNHGSGLHANMIITVLAMLAAGLLVGFINGNLITRLKMNNFITTFAMLIVVRGTVLIVSNGNTVSNLPSQFTGIGQGQIGFLPISVIVLAVGFIFAHIVMRYTRFGRDLYAVGGSPMAALAAGINPQRRIRQAYMLSGVLGAFAGWLLSARVGVATPELGLNWILDILAAAVIGGISLTGGRGAMLGALAGVLFISSIDAGLNLMRVSSFWIQTVRGVVILLAMLIDAQKTRFNKPQSSIGTIVMKHELDEQTETTNEV